MPSDSTKQISLELLDSIRATPARIERIRKLSDDLHHLSQSEIESLLSSFVDQGEDQALSRLLYVCAIRKLKLDPQVLCQCIGVTEEMPDTAPCFGLQGEEAVQPLLAMAVSESLSQERQLYTVGLAVELTQKYDLDAQPVRKVLWKLNQTALLPNYRLVVSQYLLLLDQDSNIPQTPVITWSARTLEDILAVHQSHHRIIGGTYTVRRTIPKLGRNEICHCGSGKKYKKCCLANDQTLLEDASQYAGTTRTELKNNPGLVDDPSVIDEMRAYEIKKLNPSDLGRKQLFTGYQCALSYGLRELAFEMLLESEKRPAKFGFDPGHFEDLIRNVLEAGDLDLAKKIRDHCGDEVWNQPQALQFRFDLQEHPKRYESLEQDCRKSVCKTEDHESLLDEPLLRLSYDFAHGFPALAIVFARASITSHPDNYFENEMLLDLINDARIDLDLEPWDDPVEALSEWMEERSQSERLKQTENTEVKRLSGKLETTRTELDEKKHSLRKTEQTLEEVQAELKKVRKPETQESNIAESKQKQSPITEDREETLARLRDRVENLKAEIGEQQKRRAQLREKLSQERRKHVAELADEIPANNTSAEEENTEVEPTGKLTLPEYSDAFRKTCESLPPQLASKAILAAGRFAAQEKAIWQQTKPLKRLAEHYRIRIHRDYRMMIRWQPGKSLTILDVIPRQDLVSWIKRHG